MGEREEAAGGAQYCPVNATPAAFRCTFEAPLSQKRCAAAETSLSLRCHGSLSEPPRRAGLRSRSGRWCKESAVSGLTPTCLPLPVYWYCFWSWLRAAWLRRPRLLARWPLLCPYNNTPRLETADEPFLPVFGTPIALFTGAKVSRGKDQDIKKTMHHSPWLISVLGGSHSPVSCAVRAGPSESTGGRWTRPFPIPSHPLHLKYFDPRTTHGRWRGSKRRRDRNRSKRQSRRRTI